MNRAEYIIRDGLFYSSHTGKLANFIFKKNIVVDRFYRIFIVRKSDWFIGHHHSAPVSGEPVYFAGEVKIRNGKLIGLNTNSGHYMPSNENLYNYLKYLQSLGVDLHDVKMGREPHHDSFQYNVHEFMLEYKKSIEIKQCQKFYNVTDNF
ncbi:MAG: hypothetical protein JNL11_03610 [Bdellovibrionaceae bacterium]|nr:hypothetical protein [Pseudobdellovibrionaceae bacterium]